MNPLLQKMNSNPFLSRISNVQSLIHSMQGQNPDVIMQNLLNNNSQFKSFYEANKNKSLEQICSENGIDMSLIRQLLK